ncbi:hypothetical protein N473_20260 [Pseudoalteromonas luteoviolacea CPMOR-1]|uniref:Uncharacterized protein n=1 Tax=Pseudoalteromonas luteoviolacea CPMOR-1 TaxID=1365248 RepID=A0A167JZ44_9GAMM|nr:hypothetical protein N473_20260 [Pseudoalteromonas luteoviolacea CPMOR-1]
MQKSHHENFKIRIYLPQIISSCFIEMALATFHKRGKQHEEQHIEIYEKVNSSN